MDEARKVPFEERGRRAMLPLEGVKVLDLSRVLAGPYATMVLGDLGADVLKVEHPERGDDTRHWGPPFAGGESAYFLSVNRNKRSIGVDLKDKEGLERVKTLAAGADVLIENWRRGALEKLGLGY
jgi:crotonobetainyl-CoA:carnitine CoA-transferase CaiB-like acyl-CoA transferase